MGVSQNRRVSGVVLAGLLLMTQSAFAGPVTVSQPFLGAPSSGVIDTSLVVEIGFDDAAPLPGSPGQTLFELTSAVFGFTAIATGGINLQAFLAPSQLSGACFALFEGGVFDGFACPGVGHTGLNLLNLFGPDAGAWTGFDVELQADLTPSSTIAPIILYFNTFFRVRNFAFDTSSTNGIPEPAALAAFGIGLAGLGLVRRRRMRRITG